MAYKNLFSSSIFLASLFFLQTFNSIDAQPPFCPPGDLTCAEPVIIGSYRLKIVLTSSAINNIKDQHLDIMVSRGFKTNGATSFNTVWITESYLKLQAGYLRYTWTPKNKAMFVSTTRVGEEIRDQWSTTSPEFVAGQMVTYDGTGWIGPNDTLTSPIIGVGYSVPSNSKHLVLQSPVIKDGQEVWSPYYYSDPQMSNSVLTGYPTVTLMVKLGVSIKADAFTGQIDGSETFVQYTTSNEAVVCVRSLAGRTDVEAVTGDCDPRS